jgi:hypothetical protein
MAKKARKKSAAKSKKKTRTRKKAKAPTRKRKVRKAKPRSIGNRVSSAYRTVVDTVKGTDQLRNKMEPPGTSETE